ncbi:MAG TPA: HAD family hydrolase, partial [Ktedonobacterales bacterium]|nr:HAD family hydrolase [Ktedonobacterales bacterium]
MADRGEYAVLWDVDGVLIDSGEQHRRAWEQLAREEHLPYSDAAFWATFGMRNSDIFPRMFGISGPPERIAALAYRKEAIYRALLAEDAVALPGARELLVALHT